MEGIDYAWDKPTASQIKSAGKEFVCRYLAYLPNGKVITKSELAALHAEGIGVVLNWEQGSGDALKGHGMGVAHAKEAVAQANDLGFPKNLPIYFSVDFDVSNASQTAAVASYLDGVASVIGKARTGVYGEYSVVNAMIPGHAVWGWQTYAWSGGKVSSEAHILQYHNGASIGGHDLDLDRSLKSDFGAWFTGQKEWKMTISLDGLKLPSLAEGDDDSKMAGYNYVHRAQNLLNFILTGADLTVDGVYGPATTASVKRLNSDGNGKTIGLAEWTQLYGFTKAAS